MYFVGLVCRLLSHKLACTLVSKVHLLEFFLPFLIFEFYYFYIYIYMQFFDNSFLAVSLFDEIMKCVDGWIYFLDQVAIRYELWINWRRSLIFVSIVGNFLLYEFFLAEEFCIGALLLYCLPVGLNFYLFGVSVPLGDNLRSSMVWQLWRWRH